MTQNVLLKDIVFPVSDTFKFTEQKVIFLNTSDIAAGKFLHTNYSDPRLLPGQAKKKIKNNDILFSEIRPANKRFAYVNLKDTSQYVVSTKLMVLRAKEGIYPRFAYHWITAPQNLAEIQVIAESRSGTFPQITFDTIKNLKVSLPDYKEQTNIADFIDCIDEKIELNRRMNETLEQMGQALFRHYFVSNVQAEKWENETIGDFATHIKTSVNPSKDSKKLFNQYSIPAFDNSMLTEKTQGFDIKSGKYMVSDNTILVSKLNPATPRIWPVLYAQENAVCSTEFQVVKPKKYYSFIYHVLTSREFTERMAMSAGGTSNSHRRVRPDDIFSYAFLRPPDDILSKFEEKTGESLVKLDANRNEIQTLTTLRDTLLPSLISGKIIV